MKALSIRQPWAWLIVNGHKNIENRTWELPPGLVGQRVLVHAGKVFSPTSDVPGWERFDEAYWPSPTAVLSAIIGEVTITGCVTESDSPWFEGPFGFTLADPVVYKTPVPCKGRLGFFTPPWGTPPDTAPERG